MVDVTTCYGIAAHALWISTLSLDKAKHTKPIDLTASLARPKIPKPLKLAISLQESARIIPF